MKPIRLTTRFVVIVISGTLALGLTACKKPAEEETASTTTTGGGSIVTAPGTTNETRGMFVEVLANDQYSFDIHEGTSVTATQATAPCEITTLGTAGGAPVEKLCTMEAAELDLHFFGVKLNYNVPAKLGCSYVRVFTPWYFHDEVGEGAVAMSYTLSASSTVIGMPVVTQYVAGPSPSPIAHTHANAVSWIDSARNPQCAFDYSTLEGPNCCTGKYTLTITSIDASGVPSTSNTTSEWGGTPSECLDGPATTIDPKDGKGFPVYLYRFVEGIGANNVFDVPKMIDNELADSRKVGWNISAANYFTGPTPSPFLYPPRVFSAEGRAKLPSARRPARYYEVQCLDRAEELRARIRVQLREWNDYTALQNRTAIGEDASGNENYYYEQYQTNYPYNDYWDWADMTTNTLPYPRFQRNARTRTFIQ